MELGPIARPGRGPRIFVVEDDGDILAVLTGLLEDQGYEVEGVRDGREALARLRAAPVPDLLILDLMLPVMDGWEFRTLQRRDPRLSSVPVLVITADASPKAEAIDAAGFLREPLDASELLRRIRRILDAQDRKRMQARLAEAERLATVGTLAAGAAHEISNPLAFALANMSTMQEQVARMRALAGRRELDAATVGELRAALDYVADLLGDCLLGAERVARVVRSLQSIARGQDEPQQHRAVDLRRVVDAALTMTRYQIRHRARLVTRFHDAPPVHGNEMRLGQLCMNLLSNAAQAIPEGRADDNEITVTLREVGGTVAMQVSDTGEGIDPEARGRLFEPFFTTKPAGTGMGLGLSICHSVALEHGARIEVDSVPGRGSTFRVLFPRAAGEAVAGPTLPGAPVRGRRGRVLVIDDEPQVLSAVERLLDPEHDVTVVSEGREALERLLGGERYDAIVCDLTMPNMTGEHLYRVIEQRLGPAEASRIVFLGGGPVSRGSERFLEGVPNARLDKPFDPAELRAVVQRAVAGAS